MSITLPVIAVEALPRAITVDPPLTDVDSSTGFFLPDGSMLSPDAAYVGPAKLESLPAEDYQHFLRLCPDFVIELRSHSDSLSQVKRKMGPVEGFVLDLEEVWRCYEV